MTLSLRSGLHYCDTGGHIVFLDIDKGRYFSIPTGWNAAFRAALAGDKSGQTPVFIERLEQAGIVCAERPSDPPCESRAFVEPTTNWPAKQSDAMRLILVLRVIWRQRRVSVALARSGFRDLIRDLCKKQSRRRSPSGRDSERHIDRLLSAFAFGDYAVSRSDNCLVRSVAFLQLLRRAHVDAVLVIGVTAQPFSAHAWVQRDNYVLNDTLDRVRLFSPILVV